MTERPVADPDMEAYAAEHSTPPSARLLAVARSTIAFSDRSVMMVDGLEGKLLSLIVAITAPERILEVGTFTGYSAMSMAESLPPGGRIVSLELSPEHAAKSREHIAEAGLSAVITVVEGPALQSLTTLEGPFDLSFIDADKPGYPAYYDAVVPLMRRGGLIVADNVLRAGRVLDATATEPGIVAMREFNDKVAADDRVECVMLTVRDGITLIRVLD